MGTSQQIGIIENTSLQADDSARIILVAKVNLITWPLGHKGGWGCTPLPSAMLSLIQGEGESGTTLMTMSLKTFFQSFVFFGSQKSKFC